MTTPTWKLMRERQFMVIDQPSLLIGVYPTEVFTVGVASQSAGDAQMQVVSLPLEQVPLFIQKMQSAAEFAHQELQFHQRRAAALMVVQAVERAKGRA